MCIDRVKWMLMGTFCSKNRIEECVEKSARFLEFPRFYWENYVRGDFEKNLRRWGSNFSGLSGIRVQEILIFP